MKTSRVVCFCLAVVCGCGTVGADASPVEPARLDFGPFELANPAREARVMIGPDETPEVRAAIAQLVEDVA